MRIVVQLHDGRPPAYRLSDSRLDALGYARDAADALGEKCPLGSWWVYPETTGAILAVRRGRTVSAFVTSMITTAFEELHPTTPDEHEFEVFATWLWIKRGCPSSSPWTLFA